MPELTLLVLSDPGERSLAALDQLPGDVRIIAGNRREMFLESAPEADVIFCGIGMGKLFQTIWPRAAKVRWVHSLSAGVEGLMFPAFVESAAPLTNARGVFRRSLAEFAIAAAMFFAKDLRRMVRSQMEGRWDPFDVEELHGKTLGIVGYGEIGRATAERAHAFGMRVAALRRRVDLSKNDPLLDSVFSPAEKLQLMKTSDFLVVSSALTPETKAMIGETELRAMKPSAVLINVGRGPVVVEAALVRALEEKWIRGAALDVFDTEPLPEGHPFYKLDNLLLSPHCADHTPGWIESAMQFFIENFCRFYNGDPLQNIVDKRHGY